MCVLAGRARVPQIYIKVLLPVLPLESSRFFFLLPDLKNKQVQKLFNSGGKGILSGWRFHSILVKGGHDGCCFNILLLKLSDTLKYNRFYRKHTCAHCPDPTAIVSLFLLYHISVQLSAPTLINSGYFFLSAFQTRSSPFSMVWP